MEANQDKTWKTNKQKRRGGWGMREKEPRTKQQTNTNTNN